LYILAEHNMPNLIRILPSDPSCLKVEDERYGPPIFAAMAQGNDEVILVFLSKLAEKAPPMSSLHEIYNQYLQDSRKESHFGRDFIYSKNRGVVSYLAQYGEEKLLRFLLETGDFDLDGVDKHHRSPLWWAATHGHEAMVQFLLEKDVDTDAQDKHGQTPLMQASLNGHEAIVELLLKKTRNVDMQSNGGSTALSLAALNDEPAIIKLLLQNGADADIRQRYSDQTTLSLAASKATEQLSSSYSTQAR
jgi:ankyrin repeat protein